MGFFALEEFTDWMKTPAADDWRKQAAAELHEAFFKKETTQMPEYAYECPNCGHEESTICTIAERPIKPECPKCKATLEWVPQANARVFKGRGWTPKFGPR